MWHGRRVPRRAGPRDSQRSGNAQTRRGRAHPAAAATLAIMRESVDAGTAERLNALTGGHFPGLIGFTVVETHDDGLTARMPVRPDLLAPNGYLHAATVVGLADTACGFGCRLVLPEGATGFTTIELKANFLGTVRDGAVVCRGPARARRPDHAGVGRDRDRRGDGPDAGALPLHPGDSLAALSAVLRAPAPGARRGRGRPPRPRRVHGAARRTDSLLDVSSWPSPTRSPGTPRSVCSGPGRCDPHP